MEGGGYLNGDQGNTELSGGAWVGIIATTLLVGTLMVSEEGRKNRADKAKTFVPTPGAQIELAPVAEKPILVFANQQEGKCPGDGEFGNIKGFELVTRLL